VIDRDVDASFLIGHAISTPSPWGMNEIILMDFLLGSTC
jgi:hypothetical protein